MTIQVGDEIPNINFQFREGDTRPERGTCPVGGEFVSKSSKELFSNKRVIIFSLPGAFTPTCSTYQLPGFDEKFEVFKEQGIDEIYVVSVNDAFVMFNWCKKLNIKKVKFLPDGNGDFTRKMGAMVKKNNLGFGDRSWRYSMIVNNGKIEKLFTEDGKRNNCPTDPFRVSDAETMLKYLKTQ